jgi:hypothetical protein
MMARKEISDETSSGLPERLFVDMGDFFIDEHG